MFAPKAYLRPRASTFPLKGAKAAKAARRANQVAPALCNCGAFGGRFHPAHGPGTNPEPPAAIAVSHQDLEISQTSTPCFATL